MKTIWRLKDIIDLEYFFHRDEDKGDEAAQKALSSRDRNIWLEDIQPLYSEGQPLSRRDAVKLWLKKRISLEKADMGEDAVLPGDVFDEAYRLMVYVFFIFGCMTGAGLAFSFLTYTGIAPLNVSIYLGGLVLIQMVLLLILGGFSVIKLLNRSFLRKSVIWSLTGRLLAGLSMKLKSRAMTRLSGKHRDSIHAAIGLARGKKQVYGSLFYWPVFILAQIFGAGFNIGVLFATLIRVLGWDIAFGWQSTIQISSQGIYEIVKIIAMPWSWFVRPDIAFPSLAQIEGSRMILKDGIYHLATGDMVSWWPFLCLAIFFYGLLPRVILLILGLTVQHRSLVKLDFTHSLCDKLMDRLTTPQVSTEGHPASPRPRELDAETYIPEPVPLKGVDDKGLIALIPDDIFEQCPEDELKAAVWNALKYEVKEKIRIGRSYEEDRAVLDGFTREDWGKALPNVLILQEAWQPPIQEIITFIKDLREILGQKSRIEVALIGKPGGETIFTNVKEVDWNTWNQKINIMGDPYLRLERLVKNE